MPADSPSGDKGESPNGKEDDHNDGQGDREEDGVMDELDPLVSQAADNGQEESHEQQDNGQAVGRGIEVSSPSVSGPKPETGEDEGHEGHRDPDISVLSEGVSELRPLVSSPGPGGDCPSDVSEKHKKVPADSAKAGKPRR